MNNTSLPSCTSYILYNSSLASVWYSMLPDMYVLNTWMCFNLLFIYLVPLLLLYSSCGNSGLTTHLLQNGDLMLEFEYPWTSFILHLCLTIQVSCLGNLDNLNFTPLLFYHKICSMSFQDYRPTNKKILLVCPILSQKYMKLSFLFFSRIQMFISYNILNSYCLRLLL